MKENSKSKTAILMVHCPDQKGIVAAISRFLHENNGNVIYLDQHVDHEEKVFFMRCEWELNGFLIPEEKIADYFSTLIASKYHMTYELFFSDKKIRMALFVTKLSHCLYDILSRWQDGEWEVDIPIMVSNHGLLRDAADRFGIPFVEIPVNNENKLQQEEKVISLMQEYRIDFIVLARYMQVLSDNFVTHFPNKIINIHHSFLPAFPGAKPYHSAFERGVKIIGATSHYVTKDLDAGPIIEQDVVRITHKDHVQNIIRKGQDLEKIVLARAVYAHIQHRLMVYNNKTIVFS